MLTILRGWGRFTVNGWSDAVEDAKFEFYGSNYPYVHVGVPIIALFYFDHLAWGRSTVNGWSDAVEDARFEFYGLKYPRSKLLSL